MATILRLWKTIEDFRIPSTSNRHFLPRAKLLEIFTLDALVDAVGELSIRKEDRIGLAPKIFTQGATLFAILVWMKRENEIVLFRQHGALDASLPLGLARACEIAPEFGKTLANQVQWEFLPYIFQKDMCDSHVFMRDEEILPFVEEEHITSTVFSDVSKVKIAGNQQEFFSASGGDLSIVRKQLKPKSMKSLQSDAERQPHKEEMTCLRLLHRLQHPNIVKLLGSYTYKGVHNFLFPYHDQDLSNFLELDQRPKGFGDSQAFFGALYGLASALENVHVLSLRIQEHGVDMESIGYHHDLRPKNILVDGNSFLLADFGLSKIKDQKELSQTDWKAGAGDYIAPECLNRDLWHQRVGRAIDIWAFGCLIAEVLTYLELGKKGLDEFRSGRASAEFFPNCTDQYFFTKGGVRPAVSRWLRKLASQSTNLVVQDGVDVVFWILQNDPSQRPTAPMIVPRLSVLSIRAHFLAANRAFATYLADTHDNSDEQAFFMKLWFEKERLNALETLLDSPPASPLLSSLLGEVQDLHDRSRDLFNTLLKALQRDNRQNTTAEYDEGETQISSPTQSFTAEVHLLVQGLWELFPIKYQRKMELAWRQTSIQVDDFERLRTNWTRQITVSSPQYDELSALAKMRALRLQFVHRETQDSSKNFILDYDDVVKPEVEMDGHTTSFYKGRQVLIEWEYYSPKWEKVSTKEKAALMSLKAEGLGVIPKPPDLKILDCLGFVEKVSGRHGYGFLYAFPREEESCLTSLLSLLSQDMNSGTRQREPLLSNKFRLAATLATSLLELHTVGWLHENINSHNVVWFEKESEDPPPAPAALGVPYLVDFCHSRPDSQVWYTQGPADDEHADYRHPAYSRGNRFRRVYDYYSIGIILLEIGLWIPLSYMTAKFPTATPDQFRDILSHRYASRLGPRMGLVYRDVVLSCLKGTFDVEGTDDVSETRSFGEFLDNVVEPLEELARLSL